MTDFEDRLRDRMRAEVSGVQPEERLAAIRRRTEQGTRSTWWVPMASGLAALGLVAAAVVGVAQWRDVTPPGPAAGPTAQTPEQPTEQATTIEERLVTVWVLRDGGGVPADTRTGVGPSDAVLVPLALPSNRTEPGLDAVRALLGYHAPKGQFNVWADGIGEGLDLEVRSVEHEDGVVTVDFRGPVADPWPAADIAWAVDIELFAQQLVRTVQEALETDDPVLVTQDGRRVSSVITASVVQPIQADDDFLPSVYVRHPGSNTVFAGDPTSFTVTGESNTFEGTVNWRIRQGDDVVSKGYAMGGSYGEWKRFSFDVDLPPGRYTVEVFEVSAKDGSRLSLNTIKVTIAD